MDGKEMLMNILNSYYPNSDRSAIEKLVGYHYKNNSDSIVEIKNAICSDQIYRDLYEEKKLDSPKEVFFNFIKGISDNDILTYVTLSDIISHLFYKNYCDNLNDFSEEILFETVAVISSFDIDKIPIYDNLNVMAEQLIGYINENFIPKNSRIAYTQKRRIFNDQQEREKIKIWTYIK